MYGEFLNILFKSIKYGLLALIPSVVPIIMAGGVATLIGIDLDLGTLIVGAMTMGIAVDDAIHVVSRYANGRRKGLSTDNAIRDAMNEAGRAVIFTSIILVIGFGTMSDNVLVDRAWMGTQEEPHLVNDPVNLVRGDYNIRRNKIHFADTPFGGTRQTIGIQSTAVNASASRFTALTEVFSTGSQV